MGWWDVGCKYTCASCLWGHEDEMKSKCCGMQGYSLLKLKGAMNIVQLFEYFPSQYFSWYMLYFRVCLLPPGWTEYLFWFFSSLFSFAIRHQLQMSFLLVITSVLLFSRAVKSLQVLIHFSVPIKNLIIFCSGPSGFALQDAATVEVKKISKF